MAMKQLSLTLASCLVTLMAIALPAAVSVPASAATDSAFVSDLGHKPLSPQVQDQMNYVHTWWDGKNLAKYGYIPDNDCVNFANQSLIARGWEMGDEWHSKKTGTGELDVDWSPSWISSTALYHYLDARPSMAKKLDDSKRHKVKVGDIVQFDWDPQNTPPGTVDRDHTGIVTSVEHTPQGVEIKYAGHTNNTWDKSVDTSLANNPGAKVY